MDDLVALLYSHISPEARKYTPLAEKKTQIICMKRRKVLEAYDDQGESEAKKTIYASAKILSQSIHSYETVVIAIVVVVAINAFRFHQTHR